MGDGPLGWHGLTAEELAALTSEELAALMRQRPPKIPIAYRTRPLLVSRRHFGSPIPVAPRPSQKWTGVHTKPASAAGMVGQRNVAFKPLRPSKMFYVTPAAAHIVASRLQEHSDVAPRGMWRQIMSEYGPKTLASTPSPSPREASRPTAPWDHASTLEARALWRGHVAPNGIHPPSPRARSPSARSVSLLDPARPQLDKSTPPNNYSYHAHGGQMLRDKCAPRNPHPRIRKQISDIWAPGGEGWGPAFPFVSPYVYPL